MRGAHGARSRIGQEDRQTIRRLHSQREGGVVCHLNVSAAAAARARLSATTTVAL